MRKAAAPSRSFLCLRHGVTDWNRQGLFQGRTDIPLNDEGLAQAHLAAPRLQNVPFDIIVSSPLSRAFRTAEIIAAASRKPVSGDADLIECDFGSFEGKSISETMCEHGITAKQALATILPPDGEAKLFEKFWRGENTAAGGTGLGLPIVKGFGGLMGASISAHNRSDGKGAVFTLIFPNSAVLS